MKNETHLVIILDKSGSMVTMRDETISGFNSLIKEQRKAEKKPKITLIQFSTTHNTTYEKKVPEEVSLLDHETYSPDGWTALYDTLGYAIAHFKSTLPSTAKVAFSIITDGEENASQEYKSDVVKKMVLDQTAKGWSFSYIGANQDSVLNSSKIGINKNATMNYCNVGTQSAFGSVSRGIQEYQTSGELLSFSSADRIGAMTGKPQS